jgi:hypothetical protein
MLDIEGLLCAEELSSVAMHSFLEDQLRSQRLLAIPSSVSLALIGHQTIGNDDDDDDGGGGGFLAGSALISGTAGTG